MWECLFPTALLTPKRRVTTRSNCPIQTWKPTAIHTPRTPNSLHLILTSSTVTHALFLPASHHTSPHFKSQTRTIQSFQLSIYALSFPPYFQSCGSLISSVSYSLFLGYTLLSIPYVSYCPETLCRSFRHRTVKLWHFLKMLRLLTSPTQVITG